MSAWADDLVLLVGIGKRLDQSFKKGGTYRQFLTAMLLRVRNKRGELVPLVPNRAQREFERGRRRHNIVLKARQLGITTWIAARYFLNTITRPGTVTVQVAHDQNSAEEIFRIVHRFLENLPERLQRGVLITSRANVRQIVFPRLDSEYRVETAADPNAGRGLTIRNLHCSEVARWPRDAAGTLAALRAAVAPDGEVALESTANGAGGCFYDEWQRADDTGYARHFFPWWWAEEYKRGGARALISGEKEDAAGLSPEEEELVRQHGLTMEQLAFRRRMRSNFGRLGAQEYAEDAVSCFLASGECVFDAQRIQQRLAALGGREATNSRDNGRLQLWYPPQAGREYVIGVDSAGGGSEGDYACAEVVDRRSGMQCAELHGHFPPAELALKVERLGREYNDALLVVERNNHGGSVLVHLCDVLKYENVYCEKAQAGVLTTALSKRRFVELLGVELERCPEKFSSARLLNECRAFVRHADASVAAAAGAHDDCVMAMAIAQWARWEGAGRRERQLEVGSITR